MNMLNQSGPVGTLFKDISVQTHSYKNKDINGTRVLVIRPGMSHQLSHIQALQQKYKKEGGIEYIITEDGKIDWDDVTTEESVAYARNEISKYSPDLIIAGSRGADLVAEMIQYYNGSILLFGPVRLDDVFEKNNAPNASSQKNAVVVVHGQNDTNMRINRVRYLVNNSKQELIEMENMEHTLKFDDPAQIELLVNYALRLKIKQNGGSRRKTSRRKKTSRKKSRRKKTQHKNKGLRFNRRKY